MAITVAFDGTQLSSADSSTDGGTWDKLGTSQTPAQEDNFFYQMESGSTYGAQSNKISNNTGGVEFEDDATVDYATTPKVVLAMVACATPGQINATAKGLAYYIGSALTTDRYEYYLFGSYNDYPAVGGFQFVVIDPNQAAYRDNTLGSPALGAVDYYGLYVDTTGSAVIKSENIMHDVLSYMDIGTGLTLTGSSPDGVFQDFIDFDPGDVEVRNGVVTFRGNAIFVNGMLTVGSATATTFTDANRQIFYPDHLVSEGFCGLDIDLQSGSTVVTIDDCVFVGEGRGAIVRDFHTNDDVDADNDEVDITGHGYRTGDYVDYSKKGGSDSMGLTDGNDYWVRAVTVDAISFHTTRQGAFADTSQATLSASGGTESHRLTKLTDSRPDMEVSSTSGSATFDGCSWLNHRLITFTSAASQDGGRIEAKLLTQGSADLENLTIVTCADPGEACLQDPTFGTSTDLHDCNFIQGDVGDGGHAIELDTVGGSYTFTNLGFSGYGATASEQAAIYVSAATGTTTITVSGGDTPTYRTAGATVVINSNIVVTFTGMKDTTEVRVYAAGTTTELDGIETVTAGSPDNRSFAASVASATSVDYWIFAVGYESILIKAFSWPTVPQDIGIQQRVDRNYSNP